MFFMSYLPPTGQFWPESARNEGYFRELSKDGKVVDKNGTPLFVRKGTKFVATKQKASVLPPLQAKDLPGIVVDNTDAKVTGRWSQSSGVTTHVGTEYLFTSHCQRPGDLSG